MGHGPKKFACDVIVALSGKFLMQYGMTFWKVHNLKVRCITCKNFSNRVNPSIRNSTSVGGLN